MLQKVKILFIFLGEHCFLYVYTEGKSNMAVSIFLLKLCFKFKIRNWFRNVDVKDGIKVDFFYDVI